MRDRDEVDFEELMDNTVLVKKYDTLLAYSLGMIFVEALVERYSEKAIGEIVTAINRDDAPRGLAGMEFWRDTFQSCGYSLDEAINSFYERLDREVENQREWLDSIPEFSPKFSEAEYNVFVEIGWEADEEWTPICRFRQTADAPDRQYQTEEYEDEFFACYLDFFPSGVAWYQLGLVDSDGVTIFLPWEDVALK